MVRRGEDIDCMQLAFSEQGSVWRYQGMSSGMNRRGSLDEGKIKVSLSFVVCGEDRGLLARTFSCNVNLPVMYKPFA